jgi:signal transduction histidine kinase
VASDGETRNLPELVQDHLLRIGQEALTNSLKHAQPSRIDVRLAFRTKSVTLAVSDDGCGFSAEARARENGHFGLVGMRERVSRLGGTFVLETAPGAGTKIAVVIPLESAAIMRD